ncbi:MAG: cytochrome c maturation protein CcmE [Acidimicrobiia bacterium]|nr:cytochrome c maturation protein CcmE [Acidimicrobiia bacterium]
MRRYALFLVPAIGLAVVLGGFLVFNLNDALVYYRTPAEILDEGVREPDDRIRLGGQVEPGSVGTTATGVSFQVTDGRDVIAVEHTGAPQQLFQEGIGIVVEGTWDGSVFRSDTMIIKHDEQYRTDDGVYVVPEGGAPGS